MIIFLVNLICKYHKYHEKTIFEKKVVVENFWTAGRQAKTCYSIPRHFGGPWGTRCASEQFGPWRVLRRLARACRNCRAILYPVDITEKLYNCLKCICTRRVWRMCIPSNVVLFGAVLKSFLLKDLIVNIVSPMGRQFCWMSREELRGRLTSFRHVVWKAAIKHFSAQKAFPQNRISPFLYTFYLIKTPGRTNHF